MTVAEVLQFYAPFVGLLGVVFWLGVLSNRVVTLEREERDRKEREKAIVDERDRIVRMETTIDAMKGQLDKVVRELAGVQRQLANLAAGRGKLIELPEAE